MSEVSGLVTAIGLALAGVISAIAALISARNSAAKVEDLEKRAAALEAALAAEKTQRAAEQHAEDMRREVDRRDIVLIGENLGDARADVAAMALLINQLFDQYKTATGKAPDVNIEMLKHMRTISYITGKLGPLDVEAVRRAQ